MATVPQSLVADFSKAEITSSFYKALAEKGGYEMGGAQQTVSAQLASERIAEYLDIKRNGQSWNYDKFPSYQTANLSSMSAPNMWANDLNFIWKDNYGKAQDVTH